MGGDAIPAIRKGVCPFILFCNLYIVKIAFHLIPKMKFFNKKHKCHKRGTMLS